MKEQKRTIEREIRARVREILIPEKDKLRHAKRYHKWGVVAETVWYIEGLEQALRIVDAVNRAHDHDTR